MAPRTTPRTSRLFQLSTSVKPRQPSSNQKVEVPPDLLLSTLTPQPNSSINHQLSAINQTVAVVQADLPRRLVRHSSRGDGGSLGEGGQTQKINQPRPNTIHADARIPETVLQSGREISKIQKTL
jgi:hypothetical protein